MNKKCVIVGGGIIGMMTAWELSRRQWDCTILEKSECGKEASWAGGGILYPLNPWEKLDAVHDLAVYGQKFYLQFSKQIQSETGTDAECVQSGMLYIKPENIAKAVTWLERRNVSYDLQETVYDEQPVQSIFMPDILHFRPPRFNQGLKKLLLQNGVTICEQETVTNILVHNQHVHGVQSDKQVIHTDAVVIASGSWSNELTTLTGFEIDIKPIKGQIVALQAAPNLLTTMMIHQSCYLIPRRDGLVLVGSTVEDQGFDKSTSEQVKQDLLHQAYKIAPELQQYPEVYHWAGLRPGTNRPMPYICKAPEITGLYLNTGHFRCGLILAPASALMLADIMEEKTSGFFENMYDSMWGITA